MLWALLAALRQWHPRTTLASRHSLVRLLHLTITWIYADLFLPLRPAACCTPRMRTVAGTQLLPPIQSDIMPCLLANQPCTVQTACVRHCRWEGRRHSGEPALGLRRCSCTAHLAEPVRQWLGRHRRTPVLPGKPPPGSAPSLHFALLGEHSL